MNFVGEKKIHAAISVRQRNATKRASVRAVSPDSAGGHLGLGGLAVHTVARSPAYCSDRHAPRGDPAGAQWGPVPASDDQVIPVGVEAGAFGPSGSRFQVGILTACASLAALCAESEVLMAREPEGTDGL